ncbi:MAG: TraR/DksA C4-type zinc finger protein [Deltaproteobacteria bacterium]|nr:TraR/DksA C4-type zinc finger protein [Deltaproteobacteria bacterium]
MIEPDEIQKLRRQLEERREALVKLRNSLNESWRELHTPEVEPEEAGQKEWTAQGIDQLDTQVEKEIENIDLALGEMETAGYGWCDSCGRKIPFRRLKAIPWTHLCPRCARTTAGPTAAEGTEAGIGGEMTSPSDLSSLYPDASDEELKEEILARLKEEERLDTQELEISVRSGVVILEGAVPSVTEHRMLTDLLEEMGVGRVEDHLTENPLLWERPDRSGSPPFGKTEEDVLLQGEDVDQDTFESMKDGSSSPPPDTLVPENEE